MKTKSQKKGKYLLGLLLGIVLLGVGYASITNVTLSILGSASATGSATDADFIVKFIETTDSESTVNEVSTKAANPTSYNVVRGNNVEVTSNVKSENKATFSVDNMVVNDEVEITYYIANLSNGLSANITPEITNANSENFEVTVNPSSLFNLDENEVQTVTVTVKCIKQELLDAEGTFNITFTAAAAE